MIDAFSWSLLIAPLAAQLVICQFLYLLLRRKLLANILSLSTVNVIFCAVMVVIPWFVAGVGGGLGLYFYTHYLLFGQLAGTWVYFGQHFFY